MCLVSRAMTWACMMPSSESVCPRSIVWRHSRSNMACEENKEVWWVQELAAGFVGDIPHCEVVPDEPNHLHWLQGAGGWIPVTRPSQNPCGLPVTLPGPPPGCPFLLLKGIWEDLQIEESKIKNSQVSERRLMFEFQTVTSERFRTDWIWCFWLIEWLRTWWEWRREAESCVVQDSPGGDV